MVSYPSLFTPIRFTHIASNRSTSALCNLAILAASSAAFLSHSSIVFFTVASSFLSKFSCIETIEKSSLLSTSIVHYGLNFQKQSILTWYHTWQFMPSQDYQTWPCQHFWIASHHYHDGKVVVWRHELGSEVNVVLEQYFDGKQNDLSG